MKRRRSHQRLVIRNTGARLGAATCTPLMAAVLNLDAARTTGAALYLRGVLRGFDEVDARDPRARALLVRDAVNAAAVRELPLAIVCETPWGGHVSAALSLTATVALWRDTWLAMHGDPYRFIELQVGEWRRALFGKRSLSREQARIAEGLTARAQIRAECPVLLRETLGPDAAAAVCMGAVTRRSSTVQERLSCELIGMRKAHG